MSLDLSPDFDDLPPPEFLRVKERFPWMYAAALTAASIVGCVLVVPFTASLLKQMQPRQQFILDLMPLLMALQVVLESALSIAMIALGLGLGRSLGLVWPPLDGWDAGSDRAKRMRSSLLLATGLGVLAAALMLGLGYAMHDAARGKSVVKIPAWWSCLMASIGAGIREEVWLRLGLMTFFVWVITKLTRQPAPSTEAVWTANVVARWFSEQSTCLRRLPCWAPAPGWSSSCCLAMVFPV